ncbi:MAG: hypothetical protein V3U75_10990 [Methylococcaceae bacterium]
MKTTPILIAVGLLSGGTYLVSNGFFPLSVESTSPTMDENQQIDTPTISPTLKKDIQPHTKKRKVESITKKPAKKIKLAGNESEIGAEETIDENFPDEIRNWQDGLAATADDPIESADALRYSLEKQPIDPEWSAEATDTLEKVIADEYLAKQLGLIEVDCRATMCRLELDPESEESLSKLENNLALLQGTPFTHFIIESYEESEEFNKSVVYITRNEQFVASANNLEDEDFFEE